MPTPHYKGSEHLRLWLERLSEPSFVYVIQGESDTPIKVGFAHDVERRIAGLQTGNPAELHLLHVLPGDPRLEWFLHRRLKGARLRGEWFSPDQAFLKYVSDLAEKMVAAYVEGSGIAPHYVDLDPSGFTCQEDQKRNPIKVTYMEPRRSEAERRTEREAKEKRGSITPILLSLGHEAEFTRAQREGYDRERAERLRVAAYDRFAERFAE